MCCPYPLVPSHQRLLSRDATLSAAICLNCVTLPPSVREPWGASRHGQSASSLQESWNEKKIKGGGVRLIGEERKGSEGGKRDYGQGETEKNGGK